MRGGGGEARLPKNNRNNVFFKPSTDFTVIHGGSNIFQGEGGSNISRGGRGPDAYAPPLDPRMFEQSLPLEVSKSIPESLSLRPLDVRKSIQSPRHCNSRLVKVSRVPVIATRGQYEYQETLSLPIDVSKSMQSPYRCH